MTKKTDTSGAALVCIHIAAKESPVLYACRDAPVEPEDSGWQFLCGKGDSDDELQVWSLDEVVEHEPSLEKWIELDELLEIVRRDTRSAWERTDSSDGLLPK